MAPWEAMAAFWPDVGEAVVAVPELPSVVDVLLWLPPWSGLPGVTNEQVQPDGPRTVCTPSV